MARKSKDVNVGPSREQWILGHQLHSAAVSADSVFDSGDNGEKEAINDQQYMESVCGIICKNLHPSALENVIAIYQYALEYQQKTNPELFTKHSPKCLPFRNRP